jgi:crossover junction endodeoxyribonuclease RuvC
MLRCLGIDPGLQKTGWAVIEHKTGALTHICSGVVITSASLMMPERLLFIQNSLNQIIKDFAPATAAIEDTYVNVNAKSSLKLAHARAAAMLTLAAAGLSPTEYAARAIKKSIVGSGNAEKEQVKNMMHYLIPNITPASIHADEMDAIAIAICHLHHVSNY